MEETSQVNTAPTASKPAKSRRGGGGALLIASLMAGYSVIYMDKNMISMAILPISKQFSLDTSQTGLIMSLFFLGYSLMQIPCGWLSDRFGAKRVLMASLLVIGIFAYFFGAVSGLLMFVVVRFFAGMGHGGYPPSCTKAISENFPQKRRTFVQSLILSTSGIGGILAYTLGAHLVSPNWRVAYTVLGSLYLVAFLLIWIFVPGGKKEQGMLDAEDSSASPTVHKAGEPAEESAPAGIRSIITSRNVIVLFIAMLVLNVVLYGNMSWLPSYITSKFGVSSVTAGWILSGNAVFSTVASIFSGQLLSKFFLGREKAAIIVSSVLVAVLLALFAVSNNLVVSIVLMVCISMVCMLAFTGIFTWPHKIMDSRVIGSSIGVINTGGTFGGFLAPVVIGQLVKMAGGSFTPAFLFLAVMALLAALVVVFVRVKK